MEKNFGNGLESRPDAKYERDHDPERIKQIEESLNNPKEAVVEFKGEKINIEYIDAPAKEKKREGKEKTILLIPGFSLSRRPYAGTVKELASYIGDQRVICVSPIASVKSSPIKKLTLEKMKDVYFAFLDEIGVEEKKDELTVIGHSRSDIIAMEMARSNPALVKNMALVNGIAANKSDLPGLTYDFLKHMIAETAPRRILEAFKGDKDAAKAYFQFMIDLAKNTLTPKNTVNQFTTLTERKKIDFDKLLSELKVNSLILNSGEEFTDWEATRELYEKLPEGEGKIKQHRIEAGGKHEEITAHPEAFAIKIRRWLESIK